MEESNLSQSPIYFMSKTLIEPEVRCQKLEKLVFAMTIVCRKMRWYFLVHIIIVWMNLPLKQVFHPPDLARRLTKWSIEFCEFDISFDGRKALKSRNFTNFIAKMTPDTLKPNYIWVVFMDISFNSRGIRAIIILDDEDRLVIGVSLYLKFLTTNNQVDYEVVLASHKLLAKMGV